MDEAVSDLRKSLGRGASRRKFLANVGPALALRLIWRHTGVAAPADPPARRGFCSLEDKAQQFEKRIAERFTDAAGGVWRFLAMPGYSKYLPVHFPPEAPRDWPFGSITTDDVLANTAWYLEAACYRLQVTQNPADLAVADHAFDGLHHLATVSGVSGRSVRAAIHKNEMGKIFATTPKMWEKGRTVETAAGSYALVGDYFVPRHLSVDQVLFALCAFAAYLEVSSDAKRKGLAKGDIEAALDYMIAHGMKLPGHGGVIQYSDMSAESWAEPAYPLFGLGLLAIGILTTGSERFVSQYEKLARRPEYVEAFLLGLKKKRYKHLWPHPMAFTLYRYLMRTEKSETNRSLYKQMVSEQWSQRGEWQFSDDIRDYWVAFSGFAYERAFPGSGAAETGRQILLETGPRDDQVGELESIATAPLVGGPQMVAMSQAPYLLAYWFGRRNGYVAANEPFDCPGAAR